MREKLRVMPTLRERHRYILFQVLSQQPVKYSDLEQAIWSSLLEMYGESGMSKTSFWLMRGLYDPQTQTGVVRCNHLSVPQIIAALGLLSQMGESKVVAKIIKVSGTLKGLTK